MILWSAKSHWVVDVDSVKMRVRGEVDTEDVEPRIVATITVAAAWERGLKEVGQQAKSLASIDFHSQDLRWLLESCWQG